MKLEILKDNKSTSAKVGTIMIVPKKKGKEWVKKGYAKDISNPDPEPDPDQLDMVEEIEIILEEEGSELDQEPTQKD